jgi:hypothetical protein
MKRNLLLTLVILFAALSAFGQGVPPGINYQAVARDAKGAPLANHSISLKVTLLAGDADGKSVFEEAHHTATNEQGLFNLVIGQGQALKGDLTQVPWSEYQIWMELAIDEAGSGHYLPLSATRLMAVPYAFHAGSADRIKEGDGEEKTAAYWKVNGNDFTFPGMHFLGTIDSKDLVVKTANQERMRVMAAGNIAMNNSLNIGLDLNVGRNFNAANNARIGNDLTVDRDLFVLRDLSVAGSAAFSSLNLSSNSSGFVATIENTNGDTGDGLVIKLGKTHPGWDGSAYINVPNPGAEFIDGNVSTVRGWIEGEPFQFTDVLNFIPAALIVGTTCNLVEELADQLNSALGLPKGFPGLTDAIIFDAVNSFADPLINDDWRPDNPTTLIPGFTLQFPTNFCPDFLPSFSMPNINFVNVQNSLTSNNQFVSFVDKDNRELGSIRAMSVTEWGNDYFDGVFLVQFVSNTVSLDPLDVVLSCISEFTTMADSYNKIGVEYASGHGDYAEWLERLNPAEVISRGDIVAVKGGKITKNLDGAEQIMAASEYPIVLGNLPAPGTAHLGNNVAFMGQIPVKVMGPVASGDYIVADGSVPGYGIAKPQDKLSVEDMPLVVGRSWETRAGAGPKMVNTVVGVHNGDYFRILQKYEQRLRDTEAKMETLSKGSSARMEALEAKVEMLLDRMQAPKNN